MQRLGYISKNCIIMVGICWKSQKTICYQKQLYYRAVCLAFRLATELIFLFSLLGHFSMTFRKSCAMSEADQCNSKLFLTLKALKHRYRYGFTINCNRFLTQQAPKMQASSGVRGHATQGNVLDFNSLKSPFLGNSEKSH